MWPKHDAVATVTAGLRDAYEKIRSTSSKLGEIDAVASDTELKLISNEPGFIFTAKGTAEPGTAANTPKMTVQVSQPVGALTITPNPAGSGTPAEVGTKIGTIGDTIIAFINHTEILNEGIEHLPKDRSIGVFNGGMVYSLAMPYLDADIVAQLTKVSWTPPY